MPPGIDRGQTETKIRNIYSPAPDIINTWVDKKIEIIKKETDRLAQEIFGQNMSELFDDTLLTKTAGMLWEAIKTGIGFDFSNIDYDSPDYEYLANLEKNIYQFSAAKNYNQLRAMTDALLDNNGQTRSFNDFRKEVEKINRMYNENWLKTEYNTANMAATNAGRWKDYENNSDIMPFLQYEAVMDERTRESHKQLDGVVKKFNDPFWSTYYPPNDYNCRCTVIQLPANNEKETNTKKRELPTLPKMFSVNLAKKGIAFPKNHPYFDKTPDKILKKAEKTRVNKKQRTIKDAENFALNNKLSEKVNYKGIDTEAATEVNEALKELKDKTGLTFNRIKVSKAKGFNMQCKSFEYPGGKREYELVINQNYFKKTEFKKSRELFKKDSEEGWTVCKDTKSIVYHEFGHRLTSLNLHEKKYAQKLEGISDYGNLKTSESYAEFFSLYMQKGKKGLDELYIELFNKYSDFKI